MRNVFMIKMTTRLKMRQGKTKRWAQGHSTRFRGVESRNRKQLDEMWWLYFLANRGII